jgi:protein-disulfide isomerase
MSTRRAVWVMPLLTALLACSPSSTQQPPSTATPANSAVVSKQPAPSPKIAEVPLVQVTVPTGNSCEIPGLSRALTSPLDPSLGDSAAPVTVVVFWDVTRGDSVTSLVELVASVQKTYGKDQVRAVFKHLSPADEKSLVAEAATTAFRYLGNKAYLDFLAHMSKQTRAIRESTLVEGAKIAGISQLDGFQRDLRRHRFSSKIQEDTELATQMKVSSSPTMIVNGLVLEAIPSKTALRLIVHEQILKAATSREGDISCGLTRQQWEPSKTTAISSYDISPAAIDGSPVRGPKDALVTIVQFSDYQCPFCSRAEKTMHEIAKKYPKDVRFVHKHFPLSFHKRAEPASELALEALKQKGEMAFWMVHDKIFKNARYLEDIDLVHIAMRFGMNPDKTLSAIKQHHHQTRITKDQALGNELGVRGTPAFFVNGERMVGAQPLERFVPVIERQKKRAQELLANGVSKKVLYETLTGQLALPIKPAAAEGKKSSLTPGTTQTPSGKSLVASLSRPVLTPTISSHNPSKGSATAPVTVQWFGDLADPATGRSAQLLAKLQKHYGNKLRVVWRDYPLLSHPIGELASLATHEALVQRGEKAYWEMHRQILLASMAKPSKLTRKHLESIAKSLGLNMQAFRLVLDTKSYQMFVRNEIQAGQRLAIANNAPSTFVINNRLVPGNRPLDQLKMIVEQVLADSKPSVSLKELPKQPVLSKSD